VFIASLEPCKKSISKWKNRKKRTSIGGFVIHCNVYLLAVLGIYSRKLVQEILKKNGENNVFHK
jgi:hypothetical protein